MSRLVGVSAFFFYLPVIAIVVGYLGLRIFLSSHYVTDAVRARLAQDLNCDVGLARASMSPMGTLVLEKLSLSYRKADGVHEVFSTESVEVQFEPVSLLETRLQFTGLKFNGAALALERDSEGWLTLGYAVLLLVLLDFKSRREKEFVNVRSSLGTSHRTGLICDL